MRMLGSFLFFDSFIKRNDNFFDNLLAANQSIKLMGEVKMLRYKEIKNMLVAEIAKMNSNERLPSRPELCKKLAIAKATLDKAINELVTEGMLYSRRGDGTYVADVNDRLPIQAGSWGVIVPDVAKEFYSKVVRGVEDVAQSYGINLILCNSDYDFDKQEQYIKRLNHSGVSGFILVPTMSKGIGDSNRLYDQLAELKVPFVFCTQSADGINAPVVSSNNFYGGYIAAKHLLEKGYRNIAHISLYKNRTNFERCHGSGVAFLEHGIEVNRHIIRFDDKSKSPLLGYEAMKNLLVSGEIVDAVFCTSDDLIQGVYKAIAETGLAVSDDIGVVSYNNSDICEKLTPALTSVAFKNLEVGTKAAEILYRQISGESLPEFEVYLLKPELVVRDSCLGLKKA
jgi:DNA-binding LacI/PurR family transcriptional regulator